MKIGRNTHLAMAGLPLTPLAAVAQVPAPTLTLDTGEWSAPPPARSRDEALASLPPRNKRRRR